MDIVSYIKCLSPIKLIDTKGNDFFVPCGTCAICCNNKSLRYASLISREEVNAKYSFFVTLTYSPENVPTFFIDFQGKDDNFSDCFDLVPSFIRWKKDRHGRITDYYCPDTPLEYKHLNYNDYDFEYYHKHRQYYKDNFCKTGFNPNPYAIDLCYKPDIARFLNDFKHFAYRQCNKASYKYFAVPDYGTNGLSPHWHLLFFTDSDELAAAFNDTQDFGTSSRPSPSAKFVHSLWSLGITNTSFVTKTCAHYVAGYLNRPAGFPSVLARLGSQRCYHSPKLGEILSQEDIKQHLLTKDFGYFANLSFVSYDGTIKLYSWSKSDFSRYLRKYPHIAASNVDAALNVYFETKGFINKQLKNYGDIPLNTISLALSEVADESDGFLGDYNAIDIHLDHNNTSLFDNLVYTTSRISKLVTWLGISPRQYFELVASYDDYVSRETLRAVLQKCELDPLFAKNYYAELKGIHLGDFNQYANETLTYIYRNIKHRDIAERYRFAQM